MSRSPESECKTIVVVYRTCVYPLRFLYVIISRTVPLNTCLNRLMA
jgi:hypothetical protein